MKHKPTTPANREAALRYQAERLLQDAAAWGYALDVYHTSREGHVIQLTPHAQENRTQRPDLLPQ